MHERVVSEGYLNTKPVSRFRAAGEQQGLAGSYGLAEPQQVNQQLDRVPGAVAADADDALRVGERFRHRAAPVRDFRIAAYEYL